MIRKLLIANRGEIAVRVIRAARELGIRTVAVYSEVDRHAMHAQLADESIPIGESLPTESYLNVEKLLAAAKSASADAIHPGYGFLSERAEFCEAVESSGLTFVGPNAAAMRRLGAKIEAKSLALASGVPVTPGFFEHGASSSQLRDAADRIGYPVLLKASAGGGGRGMRVVREPAEFDTELEHASVEALKAFGDGAMMVEKLIPQPRHVEVQVLADLHGNVACLFERECSIQRRHQKLIEEAPAPAFTSNLDLWNRMCAAAESLAHAAGYTNAGTVEFMVDQTAGEFYFLEVNARLQVEHPVTEAITGLDLVQWQLRIASGEKLALPSGLRNGDRESIRGHAIEARIVAEDPAKDFMPSIGRILAWAEPRVPGIRIDTGFRAGDEVSRYYDSLLAKVIALAETRQAAIARLRTALLDFHVLGVATNIPLLLQILDHPAFLDGEVDTGFIGREMPTFSDPLEVAPCLGNLVKLARGATTQGHETESLTELPGAWDSLDSWRNTG